MALNYNGIGFLQKISNEENKNLFMDMMVAVALFTGVITISIIYREIFKTAVLEKEG